MALYFSFVLTNDIFFFYWHTMCWICYWWHKETVCYLILLNLSACLLQISNSWRLALPRSSTLVQGTWCYIRYSWIEMDCTWWGGTHWPSLLTFKLHSYILNVPIAPASFQGLITFLVKDNGFNEDRVTKVCTFILVFTVQFFQSILPSMISLCFV